MTPSERLGLAVVPGAGWSAGEIRDVAAAAQDAGFDAIFTTEVNNDAMVTAQLMGAATSRIRVGTWIANVYLRHPYVCARGAALIAEDTGGRFVLGLGVSHAPVNVALGIDMSDAPADVRRYAEAVQRWLRGEGPATHLPQQPARQLVPVHVAALTSRMVEQAAEVADGLMPMFWSPERVRRSREWIARGLGRSARPDRPFELTVGLPVFCGDDLTEQRAAARANLGLYTTFPYFQRLFRASGFVAEANAMERGGAGEALSDALLDAVCLIGPVRRCLDRLAEYRDAGVDLPILYPPIGADAARRVLTTFGHTAALTVAAH